MTNDEILNMADTVFKRVLPEIGHKAWGLHGWIELIIRVVKEMENIPHDHHPSP